MHPTELLRGTLQTIILKVLKDNGKMYGYEITQMVGELSQDRILLTEGALYPALHKLENDGLVKTEVVNIGKRVRKYYTLTSEGKALAKDRVAEFVDFIRTMSAVLQVKVG
ncbi:Transcriptional regulator PadR-like family protein [Chryseolinea serpens]|uniref:Transcriptional regulator PadR-like family protein n=1 Tax=Chryseolinea serpens TaxID=947013 RepID=A0A1M5MY84_9BACT|nr:PadR family transcriptional regulator [Chryseolinea serpens]SHG82177.1 Transcriptional regulator PadR-like family protein [Chryseolinea serpens]